MSVRNHGLCDMRKGTIRNLHFLWALSCGVVVTIVLLVCSCGLVYAEESLTSQAVEHNNSGCRSMKSRDYKTALSSFDKAIELNPKNALALYNRALAKYKLGKYQNAMADFNSVLALRSSNDLSGMIHCWRGLTSRALGDKGAAITDYKDGIKLFPRYANTALGAYFEGLQAAQNGDNVQAVVKYDQAIELDSSVADWFHDRGLALAAMEKATAANQDFETEKRLRSQYSLSH